MTSRLDRRAFVRGALATTAFTIVPRHVLGGPRYQAPSDELTKAVIGVGGMGRGHLNYEGSRLVAVCDVDRSHLRAAEQAAGSGVAAYRDFREVLARPDVDIVHIATPPHWHAPIAIAAAEAGKDIWCEKPMSHTIGEGQAMVRAVENAGRIFRLNTWFRFRSRFYGMGGPVAPIKKLIDAGAFGWPLRITLSRATGFDWKLSMWSGRADLTPQPVPPELDYDFWLGPAPFKPYHPHRVHQSFRGYWDYDGGGLGDMGQHYLDPAQYLLGKDDTSPVEVEADAAQQHPDAAGTWRRVRLVYADGCEIFLEGDANSPGRPFLSGPDGQLYPGMRSTLANMDDLLDELPEPEPQITDFSEAVRTRQQFALNQANGHRSCTLVNLAVAAIRLRRKLAFDPDTQRFVNDDEANRLIDPPARGDWQA